MSEQSEKLPPHEYQRFLQNLPTDWDRKEIRRLGTVFGGGTPSRDVPSFWRGSIPWVTPGELSGNTTKRLHDTNEHISASGLAGSGANLLPVGSLMVTTRATLGARAINAVPMAANQGFKSIVFKDTADAEFYFHLFDKVQPELMRRASGTTFLEISAAEFSCIEVPSPKSSEKCLIAKVLDTLDIAIHEAEAIIAKLKAVKQGLLHDLLTRGIDANGELRPPQSEAPHLYKQSPLGWIPKEWEVRRLDEYCVSVADGTHDSPRPKESGYPLVTSKNLRDGRLDLTDSYLISEVDYKAIRVRSSVEAGDLLFGMIGTIGSPVLIESGQSEIATKNVGILRVGGNFRRGQFLKDWLNGDSTEKQLSKAMSGSTQRFIGLGTLRSLLVAEPDAIEMAHVVDLSSTAAERIDEESSLLCSLKALKVGLMDDLLTGRVRVTPLLQEAQHA